MTTPAPITVITIDDSTLTTPPSGKVGFGVNLSNEPFIIDDSGTVTVLGTGGGTVTSVTVTGANGIGVSGSPITSSGTVALSLGSITPTSVASTGGVTGSAIQSLSGNITSAANLVATGTVTGSNLSGTNTGDQFTSIAAHTYVGNNTGSSAAATAITSTQLTADLNLFTSSLQGMVPASGGGTTNFLRADGTFATPPGSGGGTVTAVSIASTNGFAGSSSGGTTPALTISTSVTGVLKGNGTAISAATSGTDYSAGTSALSTGILKSTTSTGALTIAIAGDFPTLNQNTTGSAATLTTPRNINGVAFDGSAAITVTAAAGTLTGTTLNSGVTLSSLTQVGTITSGVWNGSAVPIANGGTGQTSAANAINALLPSQTGNSGLFLTTNGTVASWSAAGSGSVTAVSVASANGFTGSSSGGATPALTLATSVTGVLKGNGTAISAATSGTDYSAGTSALSTGILKSTTTTGALTIAIAADFPTLNQNTSGSAATLTTPRAINGVNFDGSAAITVTAAAGTLTGGTLASGVTLSSLTQVGTIATGVWNGTAVDATHGGTNQTTWTTGDLLYASGTNTLSKLGIGSSTQVLTVSGGVPTWAAAGGGGGGTSYALQPVNLASTANLTLSGEQTIDGITTSTSRILVKDQSTQTGNGIYTTASGSWTRVTDFTTGAATLTGGITVTVISGVRNGGSNYQCTNGVTITIGSTNITFAPVSGAVGYGIASWGANPIASGTTSSLAMGNTALASGTSAISIGYSSTASATSSVAIGPSASAAAITSIAIGSGANTTASFTSALAIGTSASAGDTNSIAIGTGSNAGTAGGSRTGNIAIGAGTNAGGTNSIAVGLNAATGNNGNYGIAIGANTTTNSGASGGSNSNSIAIGSNATTDFPGEILLTNAAFSAGGDIHTSLFPAYGNTTTATPRELQVNSTGAASLNPGTFMVLANNATYFFTVDIVAQVHSGAAAAASWSTQFMVQRGANAAATAIIGSPTGLSAPLFSTGTVTGWAVAVTADTTNGRPAITVTGAASTNIAWVANVRMTKVGY